MSTCNGGYLISKTALCERGIITYKKVYEGFEGNCAVVLHQLVIYDIQVFVLRVAVAARVRMDDLKLHTAYTIPRLAKAAAISVWFNVFDSSLSKYRKVLSNCSS